MSIKLSVPAVAAQPDPAVETRKVYVEEWVEGLPFANPVALLRNLHDALYRFNRSPLKAAQRFALLELYLQPYRFLLELQEKQGAIHSIAALEKSRADTEATRKVAVELANGYKLVLEEALRSRSLFGKNKHVAPALQRSVLFLSFSLLHSFAEYLPTPDGLWTELAHLYAFAEERDLHVLPGSGGKLRPEFAQSVAHLYKRILLTSLVDPHHLAYGEVWRVFNLLGDSADRAGITPVAPRDDARGLFLIDPARDQRPSPWSEGAATQPAGDARLLDAGPVAARLQQQLPELERPGGGDDEFELRERRALVEIAIRALTVPPRRNTARQATRGRIRLVAGIVTLHHFLGGGESGSAAESAGIEVGGEDPAATGGRYTYSAEYWDLLNKGPGGIGLIKHIRPNNAIAVGELIGIQPEGRQRGWMIGVIRWLSIANVGEYQAGVQLLASRAEPLSVTVESRGDDALAARRALALPALTEAAGSSLVTPPGLYARGGALRVDTERHSLRVVADALVETTAAFDRFTYAIADKAT